MEDNLYQALTRLRHELHQYPEVSGNEHHTAKRILEALKSHTPDEVIHLGGTGLAAVYNGQQPGPTTLLRAELDALPITEKNNIEHISTQQGISHVCGHDGHMVSLIGVAAHLATNKPQKGRVVLLFQPAEEDGRGAIAVYKDAGFKAIKPDYVFAYHNIPGAQLGHVLLKEGVFTAAAKSIIITLTGKTSHAAEPENGHNPALAMAQITQEVLQLQNPKISAPDFALITPVYSRLGSKAYGVSAGDGELHFTLRTFSNKVMKDLDEAILRTSRSIAAAHYLEVSFSYTEEFEANENGHESIELLRTAVENGGHMATEKSEPFKWGEDFGVFTSRFKGAMFGIGSGINCPALHNPDYDFPDAILPTAVSMYIGLINQLNN